MADDQQSVNGELRRHSEPTIKRRRITKACDFCHRRGRKCKPAPEGSAVAAAAAAVPGGHPSCLTCIEHGATCTWDRIAAKRGVKSKTSPSASLKQAHSSAGGDESDRWFYDETRHGGRNLVYRLICIFFDTVYPVFPFFDDESLFKEWETSSMSTSRVAFARLMAICALSASHVRDGTLFNPDMPEIVRSEHQQAYLEDARKAIPEDNRDIQMSEVFEYLQVLGTLSLAADQIKDNTLFEQYLGRYHNLMAMSQFHTETRWPQNLSWEESYVRRQFFWSMYRLEVHSALISGHVIRCPELQCAVAYPQQIRSLAGILDSETSLSRKPETPFHGSWLTGWNYITDLYRVLEHVIIRMRKDRVKALQRGFSKIDKLLPSIDEMLEEVLNTKKNLPLYASQAFRASHDREGNLCGFQVANIACTYQLLRMAAFACENQFEEACGAAVELVNEITLVPVEYLRAIGHPMLQELLGVGHLLSNFIDRQLTPGQYYKLREVMHSMATFLQNLGPSLPNALQAGTKLFQYITKIDELLGRLGQPPPAVPAEQPLPPELPGEPHILDMIPPHTIEQYGVPNPAFYNLSSNVMSQMFSNAFNEATSVDIDWATAIENWGAT